MPWFELIQITWWQESTAGRSGGGNSLGYRYRQLWRENHSEGESLLRRAAFRPGENSSFTEEWGKLIVPWKVFEEKTYVVPWKVLKVKYFCQLVCSSELPVINMDYFKQVVINASRITSHITSIGSERVWAKWLVLPNILLLLSYI